MAVHTGKSGVVRDGTNSVGEVRDWKISETGEVQDSTVMGDDWRTNEATFKAWTGSLSCLFDPDDNGQNAFAVGTEVTFEVYPTGNTSGETEFSGTAIVTGRDTDAAYDGLVMASFQFTGDGALTKGTVA